jgi:hypothetical protein
MQTWDDINLVVVAVQVSQPRQRGHRLNVGDDVVREMKGLQIG